MTAERPFDIWRSRLNALIDLADIQKDRYVRGDGDREVTLRALPALLANFGEQQFNFFYNGFYASDTAQLPAHMTEPPASDPPAPLSTGQVGAPLAEHVISDLVSRPDIHAEHALSVILDQLANDLTVIQRAFEQRLVARLQQRTAAKKQAQRRLFATLATADRLAWHAQKSVQSYLTQQHFAGPTTVLSYLNKAPNVRMIPYAPVALIGIPMTALGYASDETPWAKDFLAIPHEFAHHLYWYGRDIDDQSDQPDHIMLFLREKLEMQLLEEKSSLPDLMQNWWEEIFADVVGCLIGGPVVALGMIDLLTAERGSQLIIDDGTHPLPIVRPYIYTETLRQIGMASMAATLEAHWGARLAKFAYPLPEKMATDWEIVINRSAASGEANKTYTIRRQDIHFAVTKVIELVPKLLKPDVPRWSDGETELDQLYPKFDSWVRDSQADQPGIPELKEWHKSKQSPEFWQTKWRALAQDLHLPDPQLLESDKLPAQEWAKLLRFGGWTTEGPGSPRGQGG